MQKQFKNLKRIQKFGIASKIGYKETREIDENVFADVVFYKGKVIGRLERDENYTILRISTDDKILEANYIAVLNSLKKN